MYEDDFEDDSTERQVSEQFGGSGDPFPEGGERDKEIAGAGKVRYVGGEEEGTKWRRRMLLLLLMMMMMRRRRRRLTFGAGVRLGESDRSHSHEAAGAEELRM
eukprot:762103-Hanusia_phi.AAC.2